MSAMTALASTTAAAAARNSKFVVPALTSQAGTAAPGTLASPGAKPATDLHAKARANAVDFESVFLSSMFSQMFTGIDGDGPFGGAGGAGMWRSFLSDEYGKSFAKSGGVGLADHVYRALITQQEAQAK
jgi:Rod binding domain-containing protein